MILRNLKANYLGPTRVLDGHQLAAWRIFLRHRPRQSGYPPGKRPPQEQIQHEYSCAVPLFSPDDRRGKVNEPEDHTSGRDVEIGLCGVAQRNHARFDNRQV